MPLNRRGFLQASASSTALWAGAARAAQDAATAAEIQEQLPDRLFDVHAHLYRNRDLGNPCPELTAQGPDTVDMEAWLTHLGKLTDRKRLVGGLFFPYPVKNGNMDAGNTFLLEQVNLSPMARGLIVVTPGMDRDKTESYFQNSRIIGFKPYHVFADFPVTFDAPLDAYIPEWVWAMADKYAAVILLHIVRHAALSDPENQKAILKFCTKYPNANLVLAHAGRGFHAPNTIRALPVLKELNNVYFDTSAVCESDALMAIVKTFGPQRLMWGSDFPVSQQRGKCVTVGDAFSWICPRRIDVYPDAPVCNPTLVGLESLRAVLLMASLSDLSKQDREDLFYRNALRLLRIQDT